MWRLHWLLFMNYNHVIVGPLLVKMTKTSGWLVVELARWVRRWLVRPIWARKSLPQIGQEWVWAVLLVLVALALCAARFFSA